MLAPVADLWSGTYTFLLTDIEGSTRLWEAAPADMARALVRHDDLIAAVVGAAGGRLVRSRGEGDSAFAVFDDTRRALVAAVELQRALHLEPWPAAAPIRVRMAVHSGPAQARGDDFFGQGVNRAARIRSIAHGGQLLVSEDVHRAMAGALPDGIWVRDLGLHRLKDLTRPERVWQVGHPDITVEFPPLRSLDARGHNLPVQLTAFVGRELEILDIRKRLEMSSLLTLTGAGGIGKTRLALQAAAESAEDFPDGVWLVELAPVSDPDLVTGAIASALGVREEAGRDLSAALCEHLMDKRLLLVMDNCEHLIERCAQAVHELLQSSEGLHVIATSREPLRVYGEAIFAVPTLALPDADSSFPEEAMESEAVRLFVDRATLADREFSLGPHAADVTHICRRLEGIPLAIELAAAMTRTATPTEIKGRLDDRLGVLAEGPRTAPARQQTLRAAIDWSYDLLSDAERLAFERLAVFSGGFMVDAARAVLGWDGLEEADVGRLVDRLADRSLLVIRDDEERRFRMLDTVREYATERARDRGELAASLARHAAWASTFGLATADKMRGPTGPGAIADYAREQDNFRAALQHAIASRDESTTTSLIRGVFYCWFVRGQFSEGRSWLTRAVDAFPDAAARTTFLLYDGQLANAQGDVNAAVPLLEESIALARAQGDRLSTGIGLNALATSALQLGRLDDVKVYGQEALTLLRVGGQQHTVAQSLNILGVAAALEGDEQAALNYYEDALAISREMGMQENVARLLMNLGNMALARSEYDRARTYYLECRATALGIGDAQTASGALANIGVVAKAAGELDVAREFLAEAMDEKLALGDGRGQIVALQGLGDIDRREGRFADARAFVARSLELCRDLNYVLGVIQGLELLASNCADESGWAERGLRFASAADTERERSKIRRNDEDTVEFERAVGALRAELGPQDADRVWEESRHLDPSVVIDEAIAFGRTNAARTTG
jgi:predicted ATPase/class 3 adenylate cyclase